MPRTAILHEPSSTGCVTLPEVVYTRASGPALAPLNETDEWAVVFTGTDCTGGSWTLGPHGNPTMERVKLRSVYLTGRH